MEGQIHHCLVSICYQQDKSHVLHVLPRLSHTRHSKRQGSGSLGKTSATGTPWDTPTNCSYGAESDKIHFSSFPQPTSLLTHLCRSSSRQFTMAFLCSMMVTSSCINTFSLPRSSSVQSFSTQTNPKEGQAIKWLKQL